MLKIPDVTKNIKTKPALPHQQLMTFPTLTDEQQHRPHLNLHPLHPDLNRIIFLHSGFDKTAHRANESRD